MISIWSLAETAQDPRAISMEPSSTDSRTAKKSWDPNELEQGHCQHLGLKIHMGKLTELYGLYSPIFPEYSVRSDKASNWNFFCISEMETKHLVSLRVVDLQRMWEARGRAKYAAFFYKKMSCVLSCLQDALMLGSPLLVYGTKKVSFICSCNWSVGLKSIKG